MFAIERIVFNFAIVNIDIKAEFRNVKHSIDGGYRLYRTVLPDGKFIKIEFKLPAEYSLYRVYKLFSLVTVNEGQRYMMVINRVKINGFEMCFENFEISFFIMFIHLVLKWLIFEMLFRIH